MMKLSEQIDVEYDKAEALSGRCDIPRDTLLGWKILGSRLESTNTDLLEALDHCRSLLNGLHLGSVIDASKRDAIRLYEEEAREAISKAKSHADTLKGDCPDCEGTGKQTTENGTYQYDCLSCNGKGQ